MKLSYQIPPFIQMGLVYEAEAALSELSHSQMVLVYQGFLSETTIHSDRLGT
jgi:hypothetical protein